MGIHNGTDSADKIVLSNDKDFKDESYLVLAGDGDDTIYGNTHGSAYSDGGYDSLYGGDGDDTIVGVQQDNGNGDLLSGDDGNDNLYGSAGDDLIVGDNIKASEDSGANNNDVLRGYGGDDKLRGGIGDDVYYDKIAFGGQDTLNEDLSQSGSTGFGGGDDDLVMLDVDAADMHFEKNGDDLQVTNDADAADGSVDKGVTIEDFYTGGANVVEQVISADNMVFDVTALL